MGPTSGIGLSIFCSLLLQVFLISSISEPRGHVKDETALLSFKAGITEDPFNILRSWNTSQHFCKWQGVTCGRRHKRVTSLDLVSCKLKGQLSSHIGNLSFLRSLNLLNNSFIHDIPPQISKLHRLKYLALGNNSFSGKIPTNLSRCSNLQHLDLSFNELTGKVPGLDISLLSKLQVLLLNNNNLFGEIPTSLGNLSFLMRLHLGDNKFHGEIPHSFGQLKSLVGLAIYANIVTGIIPPSIYNITSLQVLMLQTNQLEGTVPPDLGNSLPNIQDLMLHANRLSGTLPLGLGNYLPNLQVLTLQTNRFSGKIPVTILNMSKVTVIEMSQNYFTGEVPHLASLSKLRVIGISDNNLGHGGNDDLKFLSSLENCTNLEVLGIENNKFGGVMPESISNFSSKLRDLVMGRNQISGSIPTHIGNLVNLARLGLDNNLLFGVIPSSVGRLQKLYALGLGRNKLSGHIPSSLGNLTSLSIFDITQNNIKGSIPSNLGQCGQLLFIRLSKNSLSGLIPKELIRLPSLVFIDLGKNQFTGSIPMEVGKLVNIVYLDVSENKVVGKIPESLGGCTLLRNLYLQRNSLQGTIPHSLSSLRGLDEIDLSHNNLSGEIPTYFGGFRFLKKLNVSFNNLEGMVPIKGVFKNLSGLSLTGNKRLCGGVVQLHLPRCPSERQKKHKGSSHKKLIISGIACGLGLILMVLLISFYFSSKQRTLRRNSGTSDDTKSFIQLSYGDLVKATDTFSPTKLIGAGSFGSVYKGILYPDETVVAVKVLNLQIPKASKSFIAECKALRNIRHRNLVKILTACSSIDFQGNDFKALVYEFMANGSLEEWLHEERPLSLLQRVNIAIDVASALDYPHNRCGEMPIVHCDLKPSNILLDNDITAHVGDFGLVRFLVDPSHPFSSNHSSSIGLRGTVGYAAPEYGMESEVTTSGDVYSYGILLLEMFTGKRPTDGMFRDDLNLHNFALMALPEKIEEILDPMLLQTEDGKGNNKKIQNQTVCKCMISIVEIGVACSVKLPGERMSINNVVSELSRIRDVLLKTKVTEI